MPRPNAPSNLVASVVGSTQVDLAWHDNSNNEAGFIVQRGAATIAKTPTGVATYSDKTVSAGAAYQYLVRAYNNKGSSSPSNGVSVDVPATATGGAKKAPAGIIVLMTGRLPNSTNIGNHPSLAQKNMDGIRVKQSWEVIEPNEGAYNWTGIDAAFKLAKSHGKGLGISIEAGSNQCPPWLFNGGAQAHTIVHGKEVGDVMPVVGDPVFLAKWARFIKAFGAKYDADPALLYMVVCGIGSVVEWYTADADFFEALSPPNPPGTQKWIDAGKAIIDAYADAFLTTPFFGALANPYGGGNGQTAEQILVTYGLQKYPRRFGLMTNTLSARSTTNFYPNKAINQNKSTQPTGFQMLWSCYYDGGKRNGIDGVNPDPNALDESLSNGVQIGGRFCEVYEPDTDANKSPSEQDTLTRHQTQFKAMPMP